MSSLEFDEYVRLHRLFSDEPSHLNPSTFNGTNVEGDGGEGTLGYSAFYHQQSILHDCAVAGLVVWLWELVMNLPDEWRLYRQRRLLSAHVILFLLVRYGSIPAIAVSSWLTFNDFGDPKDGDRCPQHTELLTAVVQLFVASMFAWRAAAIWRRDKRIIAVVTFVVCAQFATSMSLLYYSDTKLLPNGTCMPVPMYKTHGNLFPWFYLAAFLTDSILVGLSTWKLLQYTAIGATPGPSLPAGQGGLLTSWRRSVRLRINGLTPLLSKLLTSGFVYFSIATLYNLVNMAFELSNSLHAKAVLALYAPLMSVLCSRIILMEVYAVYGSGRPTTGSRERDLVDRVLRAQGRRESWEGEDYTHLEKAPPSDNSPSQSAPEAHSSGQYGNARTLTESISPMQRDAGSAGTQSPLSARFAERSPSFFEVLEAGPPSEGRRPSVTQRFFGSLRSSFSSASPQQQAELDVEDPFAPRLDSTALREPRSAFATVFPHHSNSPGETVQSKRRASASAAVGRRDFSSEGPIVLSEEQKSLALRLAGLHPSQQAARPEDRIDEVGSPISP